MIPEQIFAERAAGALFVISHSGGKDSQAMTSLIRALVPASQILVVHASLGDVEWPGTVEHIRKTTVGLEFEICAAEKSFLDMVRRRGMWPSSATRQCTSDLKRGPIERTVRQYIKSRGLSGRVVMCMGMRAEESSKRAQKPVFLRSERNSKAGREWFDWLPIHRMSTAEVFETIRNAGQEPHWAYAAGMSRLSCSFCIMASAADLKTAARLRPDLFRTYCEVEREIDHTFVQPRKGHPRRFLPEVVGILESEVA